MEDRPTGSRGILAASTSLAVGEWYEGYLDEDTALWIPHRKLDRPSVKVDWKAEGF